MVTEHHKSKTDRQSATLNEKHARIAVKNRLRASERAAAYIHIHQQKEKAQQSKKRPARQKEKPPEKIPNGCIIYSFVGLSSIKSKSMSFFRCFNNAASVVL